MTEEFEYKIGTKKLTFEEAKHYYYQLKTYKKDMPVCILVGKDTGKIYNAQYLNIFFE